MSKAASTHVLDRPKWYPWNFFAIITFAWGSLAPYRDLNHFTVSSDDQSQANTSSNQKTTAPENISDSSKKLRFPNVPISNKISTIVSGIYATSERIKQANRNLKVMFPFTKAIISYGKWQFFWCFFFLALEAGCLIVQIQFVL